MPFEATLAPAPALSSTVAHDAHDAHDDTHARSQDPKGARALDALAMRAQRGEGDAVQQLLEALAKRLRRLVGHRVLKKRGYALSEADVEDALHDVLVHIWQHDLPMFDP